MPEKHVFINESRIWKDLVREYDRAKAGVHVKDVKHDRKFHRTNVVATLCNQQVLPPKCYECSMTGDFFEGWAFQHRQSRQYASIL
ncbi:hypothetical protein LQZ18_05085 [Lachnospiraceae bacterium ZAX-1]